MFSDEILAARAVAALERIAAALERIVETYPPASPPVTPPEYKP